MPSCTAAAIAPSRSSIVLSRYALVSKPKREATLTPAAISFSKRMPMTSPDRTGTKHPEPRQAGDELLEEADALFSDGILATKRIEHISRHHPARSGVALSKTTLDRVHSDGREHDRLSGLQFTDYSEASRCNEH